MSELIVSPLHQTLIQLAESDRVKTEHGSLYALASVLSVAFSHLNHLTITADQSFKTPFSVGVSDGGVRSFPRREFTAPNTHAHKPKFTQTTELLPTFNTRVVIGPSFNVVRDLPALTKQVEDLHNQQMMDYGQDNPMVFINTSAELAQYWDFLGNKLQTFIATHITELEAIKNPEDETYSIGTNLLAPTLESYAVLCSQIATGFKHTEPTTHSSSLAQIIDASPVLDKEWEKIEQFLLYQLASIKRKSEDRTERNHTLPESGKTNKPPLLKLLTRFTGYLGKKTQLHILGELNTQARKSFIQHAEADLYRKAGLGELLKRAENVTSPTEVLEADDELEPRLIKFVKERFPIEEAQILAIKTEIKAIKMQLNSNSDNEPLMTKLASRQKTLAKALCAIVYSEKFFFGIETSYSYADIAEQNFVNCMAKSEVLYQLWREYAGEEALGASNFGHYFSVVRLANGDYLSLDSVPRIMGDRSDIFSLGDHTRLYQAAFYSWEADKISTNPSRRVEAEQLYREAIRLAPNNLDFIINLANLLKKDPGRHVEAEQLYKEAIILDPTNPWLQLSIADFYQHSLKDIPQAVEHYQEALKLKDLYPEKPTWMIRDRVVEILKSISPSSEQ